MACEHAPEVASFMFLFASRPHSFFLRGRTPLIHDAPKRATHSRSKNQYHIMVLGRPLPDGGQAAVMFRPAALDEMIAGKKTCPVYSETTKSREQMKREGDGGVGVKSCFGNPEPAPPMSANGRPTTRTAMLEMRREKEMASLAATGERNAVPTLPVGVRPGAPGKNPGMIDQYGANTMKKFSHTERVLA